MQFSASLQHILRQATAQAPRPLRPGPDEQSPAPQQAGTELPRELPAELDQRVRLIGEW
jgi:hypothetical protein